MKKHWMFIGIAIVAGALALGAIACSSNDNEAKPTATESMETPSGETPMTDETPMADETPAEGAFTTVVATEDPALGTILTTYDGYTLYTFDNDTEGVSNCTGDCATTWPPLPVAGEPTGGAGVTGTLDTITRDDGSTQVTYDGKPLYMYSGDSAPGDTNGDGFNGIWHVVSLGG
jgi:predicted lipoprotein with Yx(FWY)xxD motif